jgi:serine phosphatase RsbU (regulator of sigma subunit)
MIRIRATAGENGRRLRLASAVALLVALLGTALASWSIHTLVHDQKRRLLRERASELNLVLASSINAIPAALAAQGGILKATGGSGPAYAQAAREAAAADPGATPLTFAWLRPAPDGSEYVVSDAVGPNLRVGEVISDERVQSLNEALHSGQLVPTAVVGPQRKLGFALGPPAAPAGTVLYRETSLGPIKPPRAAASAPFSELAIVIYSATTPRSRQVVASTTTELPLRGQVENVVVPVGAARWLTVVKAKRPLVGPVADNAWWIALLVGAVGSLLLAAVIEIAARRRDAALALYASEHQVAETLQRSLLPQLPQIAGLDLAARYLAGGTGQEVGGDWFDAFPVGDGRVGIAVGDVIGHDLVAASAMAQIRASLRAYAVDGDRPSSVINRLAHLIDTLALTQLVTVIYAVLEPAEADGTRLFTYSNAGHLPPLLRLPSGEVQPLVGGDSVVIGAPISIERTEVEQRLLPGSILLLFTDGLVEIPGRPLDDGLRDLSDTLAAVAPAADLEELCDNVLALTSDRILRDDVALLALRIGHQQIVMQGHAGDAPIRVTGPASCG